MLKAAAPFDDIKQSNNENVTNIDSQQRKILENKEKTKFLVSNKSKQTF